MNNNKICSKCGTVVDADSKFCINCGEKLDINTDVNTSIVSVDNVDSNNNQSIPQNEINNDDSNATILGIVSLALFFLGSTIFGFLSTMFPFAGMFISNLSGLCPLAGLSVMIFGRIKYPENKFLKIVMWIIIISIIVVVVGFISFCIWCFVMCSNADLSGFY